MAESFLEQIYREAALACKLKAAVEFTRVYDDIHTVDICNNLLAALCDVCKQYLEHDKNKGLALWEAVQALTRIEGDLVLYGDTIENGILPLLREKMALEAGNIYLENEEGDFLFESSASGFLTIKDLRGNRYVHSTVDPMWEARKQAEYIYKPELKSYSVRGCGLGYLAYQLYDISDGTAVINVYEKDERMVEYAKSYGVLEWVPGDRINVRIDPDAHMFIQSMQEPDTGCYISAPALAGEPEGVRALLETYYMDFETRKKLQRNMEMNYWSNKRSGCKAVSAFDTSLLKEDFIVAAAGPSLDGNLAFLRESQGKRTLIAVGTVFKKLLACNIMPDMVVVLDPQPRTYKQIEGAESEKVPMLLAMTAYWKFAANYQGDKYLVPLSDVYEEKGEEEAWEIGGTVTHLAIEAAVRFGAKRIYLAGVDLAYPNGSSHADGTMDAAKTDRKKLIPVEGNGGMTVYTSKVFLAYKKWIEERILRTQEVVFYNMSSCGAKIAGAESGKDTAESL